MKIQYASDLHLEFKSNTLHLLENPLTVSGEILVLAGDIAYMGSEAHLRHPFWDWAAGHYREVLLCPGNHEFYKGYDLSTLKDGHCEFIRPNVRRMYNAVVNIEETDIILSTLWSHIPPENEIICAERVADFARIAYAGDALMPADFNREHDRCAAFIRQALETSTAKHKIVVTHHLPSPQLLDAQFTGSRLNGAYVSDLTGFVSTCGADYWIFGHSHRNICTRIGRTLCLSNQLGYVHVGEGRDFNPAACIDTEEQDQLRFSTMPS